MIGLDLDASIRVVQAGYLVDARVVSQLSLTPVLPLVVGDLVHQLLRDRLLSIGLAVRGSDIVFLLFLDLSLSLSLDLLFLLLGQSGEDVQARISLVHDCAALGGNHAGLHATFRAVDSRHFLRVELPNGGPLF